MRSFEITRDGRDGPMRLRATETGRVLAVITPDEARQLWIGLGSALGLGTDALTIRNVERASSLRALAKRLKKTAA